MRNTIRSNGTWCAIFSLAVCFLFLSTAFQPMVMAELGAPPINGEGNEDDWVLENGDSIYRVAETIVLNSNLTVMGNATLTLDNVTLKMNGTSSQKFRIEILAGGTLNIINQSTIMSMC